LIIPNIFLEIRIFVRNDFLGRNFNNAIPEKKEGFLWSIMNK
jgi:hypothetical protein